MKVLLINPPNYNIAKSSSSWDLEIDNIGLYPPIGLMYIASYLRESTGYEIQILDTLADRMDYEDIEKAVKGYSPDLVGITSFTLSLFDLHRTIRTVRKAVHRTHICVGGPHTYFWHNETIQIPEVDSVIVGDGEIVFTDLARALHENAPLGGVKGLILEPVHNLAETGTCNIVDDIDSLPVPAFDLVPFEKYYTINSRGKSVAVIFSSRGCPFTCSFCDKTSHSYRARSIDKVLEEMETYYREGVREFLFF